MCFLTSEVRGLDTPCPSLARFPDEEGRRRKEALLWLKRGEQCPLFSFSADVSSYVIQYSVQQPSLRKGESHSGWCPAGPLGPPLVPTRLSSRLFGSSPVVVVVVVGVCAPEAAPVCQRGVPGPTVLDPTKRGKYRLLPLSSPDAQLPRQSKSTQPCSEADLESANFIAELSPRLNDVAARSSRSRTNMIIHP